jgi:hypothetical protein
MDESSPGATTSPPAAKTDIALIAYGGFVSAELAIWLAAHGKRAANVYVVNRRDVRCARNEACARFLSTGSEVLVMINHDLVLPPAFLGPFEVGSADVVTGHVGGPDGEYHPGGHGTGIIAIRRRVLVALESPWFRPPQYSPSGVEWTACECQEFEARAKAKGFLFAWWKQGLGHRHVHDWPAPVPADPPPPAPVS